MQIVDCFSQSYAEAREKFLAAVQEAGLPLQSVTHPLTGPKGEELALDIVRMGPDDAERVLVIGSATHGVEGFCGSGLQTALIRDGLAERLPENLRIVFLHANNPYGFAHLRRVNEDNVDLNRNFLDHSKSHPVNRSYEALSDAIAPVDFSPEGQAEAANRLLSYGQEHGQSALQEAVSGGQYSHPTGLFYGGTEETWSNKTLRTAIGEHCGAATHVALVDFHTGLGDYGYGEIIYNEPPDHPMAKRVVAWWGDRAKGTKVGGVEEIGGSVSADLVGPLKLAFDEMCPTAETTAVSLEYGTVPQMEVFFAMQAENWAHHHCDPNDPRYAEIKNTMRDAFYCDEDDWKQMVWEQAQDVISKALNGLAR